MSGMISPSRFRTGCLTMMLCWRKKSRESSASAARACDLSSPRSIRVNEPRKRNRENSISEPRPKDMVA